MNETGKQGSIRAETVPRLDELCWAPLNGIMGGSRLKGFRSYRSAIPGGLGSIWRFSDGTYSVFSYRGRGKWNRVDPLVAQCVLNHLFKLETPEPP